MRDGRLGQLVSLYIYFERHAKVEILSDTLRYVDELYLFLRKDGFFEIFREDC